MDLNEESDTSLEALQRRIDQAKAEQSDENVSSGGSKLGKAMHVATEFLAAVGVGGAIGYFLDRAFETSPVWLIVFFFIGFAAGVRNLLRVRDL